MRLTRFVLGPAAMAMVLVAPPALAQAPATPGSPSVSHRPVCGPPAAGFARCHAEVVTEGSGSPLATASYSSGYRPADLASAYKYSLPAVDSAWAWNGQTVAIVELVSQPPPPHRTVVAGASGTLPIA